MDELGVLHTLAAVIPIGAVQALVADTIDELVTAIADSRVANIPTRVAEEIGQRRKDRLGRGRLESMARMMTMLVVDMALQAEVVVVTSDTGDELALWQNLDAAVASASRLLGIDDRLLFVGKCAWYFLFLGLLSLDLGLGCDALGSAVYHVAILDKALDHPVASSRAMDTIIHAFGAEVIVTSIAYAAVEVLILHRLVAIVAVHDPRGVQAGWLRAEGKTWVAAGSRELVEEV